MKESIAALLVGACGGHCPTAPAPIPRTPVVVEQRACLAEPPPDPAPLTFDACPGSEFVACLTRESSLALVAYLRDLRRYASDAWIACGTPIERKAQP